MTYDQMRKKEEINPNVSADRFSLPLHFLYFHHSERGI